MLYNKIFAKYARKYLVKYMEKLGSEFTPESGAKLIADHYTYATEAVYESLKLKTEKFTFKK